MARDDYPLSINYGDSNKAPEIPDASVNDAGSDSSEDISVKAHTKKQVPAGPAYGLNKKVTRIIFEADDHKSASKNEVVKRKATPKLGPNGKEDVNKMAATDYVNGLFDRMLPDDEEDMLGPDGKSIHKGKEMDDAPGDGIFSSGGKLTPSASAGGFRYNNHDDS